MLITHKKLQPVQCYHIFSNSRVVYLAKNHYGSYSPKMVPTNPPGSWPTASLFPAKSNWLNSPLEVAQLSLD